MNNLNWIEIVDGYLVFGWWPRSAVLQMEFGVFVTILDSGEVWRLQFQPIDMPGAERTPAFFAAMEANRDKPYFIGEGSRGKLVYIRDATQVGVLRFIKETISDRAFASIFEPFKNLSGLRFMPFKPLSTEKICSGSYFQNLKAAYGNGNVVLKSLHTDSSKLFQSAINDHYFFWLMPYYITLNKSVLSQLDDLKPEDSVSSLFFARELHSYGLVGELLTVLRDGGAYGGTPCRESLAGQVQATAEFIHELIPSGVYAPAFAYYGAWTPFFLDIFWDFTFIIFDPSACNVHYLYMTDSD